MAYSTCKNLAVYAILSLAALLRPVYADEQAGADRQNLTARLAQADVSAGEKTGKACLMCHSIDKGGANKIGPNLWNIVGAKHAHMDNFSYSGSIKSMAEGGRIWSDEELNDFLYNPRGHAPDTKMAFAGVKNAQDRANLIAWLHTLADNPQPLPKEK